MAKPSYNISSIAAFCKSWGCYSTEVREVIAAMMCRRICNYAQLYGWRCGKMFGVLKHPKEYSHSLTRNKNRIRVATRLDSTT